MCWNMCHEEAADIMSMDRWNKCDIPRVSEISPSTNFSWPFIVSNVSSLEHLAYFSRKNLIAVLGSQNTLWREKAVVGNPRGIGTRGTFNEFITTVGCNKTDNYMFTNMQIPYNSPVEKEMRLRSYPTSCTIHLGIGGHMTGLSAHKHGDAWNHVIYGRKKWFLTAPSITTNLVHISASDAHTYINHSEDALECLQFPGEILFVPQNWTHATVNMDETVSVTNNCRLVE